MPAGAGGNPALQLGDPVITQYVDAASRELEGPVRRRRERDPLVELTDREREVLALMAQGLTNAALSEELVLSPKTIKGYVRNVFAKLGLEPSEREHRRVLAVLQFLRWR